MSEYSLDIEGCTRLTKEVLTPLDLTGRKERSKTLSALNYHHRSR
jgi:hypothetical protein